MLIKHNNTLYSTIVAGPWNGLSIVKVDEVKAEPKHQWSGKKVPASLVRQIKNFFAWSMEETKSEVVVTLMYHEDLGWGAMVLPQEGYRGMVVNLLPDHANRIPTFQRFGMADGKPWQPAGSWHHHCRSSAFASGVDKDDEVSKEGLHLTSGNLDKDKWDIHARASFRGCVTPVELSEWFELEAQGLAPHLHEAQLKWQLTNAGELVPKDATPDQAEEFFPQWWKDNVIKPAYLPYQYHQTGLGFAAGTSAHSGWRGSSVAGGAPSAHSAGTRSIITTHGTVVPMQPVSPVSPTPSGQFHSQHQQHQQQQQSSFDREMDFRIYLRDFEPDDLFEAATEWYNLSPLSQDLIDAAVATGVEYEEAYNMILARGELSVDNGVATEDTQDPRLTEEEDTEERTVQAPSAQRADDSEDFAVEKCQTTGMRRAVCVCDQCLAEYAQAAE